jgi:hypothetical protein
MDFIRPLVHRLKINDSSLSEEDVRKAFESYTLLTLDLAMTQVDDPKSPVGISHESLRLSDMFANRIASFQKTSMFKVQRYLSKFREFDLKSNMSLA